MADGEILDPRFEGLRAVLDGHIAAGNDVGSSFCATLEGKTVVDIWGGHADEAKTRPWEKTPSSTSIRRPRP